MKNIDLTPVVLPKYCDDPANEHRAECALITSKKENTKTGEKLNARLGKRSATSLKPISAIHLTNITLLVPDISEHVHAISQKSIIYDPISEDTLNQLSYTSPWAAVTSYNPRHAILKTRSTISNVTDVSSS